MSTEADERAGRTAPDPTTGVEYATTPERLAADEPIDGRPELVQTPSQTVGPFFGYALPWQGGAQLVPAVHPDAVRLHGRVLDGHGDPVPDALVELWQPDADGTVSRRVGSRVRERGAFTGFGRVATDLDGGYEFVTVLPGAVAPSTARWAAVTVFARGLLHHLFTRAYFVRDGEAEPEDALLAAAGQRRDTLLARADSTASYRFDLVLQGDGETVFLDYPG